jgi:polynucleotide 5'-hydroxyl-kinase GRC3/NOL9
MLAAPGWAEALRRAARVRTTVVVGGTDSGKTTLCAFLAGALWRRGAPVVVLDADVGQSEIGPPTTLGIGRVSSAIGRLADVAVQALWFAGATSPAGCAPGLAMGVGRLAAHAAPGDQLIVDTGGPVSGPLGVALKRRKLAVLRPDLVIALERGRECDGALAATAAGGRPDVLRLPVSGRARVRPARERARFRAEAFTAYFAGAPTHELPLDAAAGAGAVALAVRPPVDGRVLVGVDGEDGSTLGLGLVRGVSPGGRSLSVSTPVPRARIAAVRAAPGSVALSVLHEVLS